jgi:hypothetical protein
MPRKIYAPDQYRPGGGTVFSVSWDRIEDFLRGKEDRFAGTNAVVGADERCDFVITAHGINVYTIKESDVDNG